MKSNYKKLGNFIREVDKRNDDDTLGEDNLFGISVTKDFIISHANLVGVTFESYKVVEPRQFAYIPDTSRRGDKIAISLNSFEDKILVSSICSVFEIVDESVLLPEYLMLWFSRPEFDRYARFMSNGSAREVFDWDCMCGVEIPVPSIDKQKEMVRAYQVIINRIRLLKQINANLEEQSLALFNDWFASYGPFGGEKPSDWKCLTLGDVAKMSAGGDRPDVCVDVKTSQCNIPIYSNGIEKDGLYGYTDAPKICEESVTVSARGTIGFVCLRNEPYFPIVRLVTLTPIKDIVTAKYLYLYLKSMNIQGTGSTQQQLTVPDFQKTEILIPPYEIVRKFTIIVDSLFSNISIYQKELECLETLANSFLSKVAI